MEIKDAELTESEGGVKQFKVTFEDDTVSVVPDEPANRHYVELAAWYDAQKNKPFKFKFKKPE